jgi:lipoprotein NlpD
VLAFCGALLSGCAGLPPEEAETYVVKPQDTLYSIAWRHGLDYQEIARWNHLGPGYKIVVGQTLTLQGASLARPPVKTGSPATTSPRTPVPAPAAPPIPSSLKWMWPTEHLVPPQNVPSGGILISGHLGQEVHAACAGRVVYVGNGIRGYGNLVIVKHGENLLSAYAHNRDVSVHEGDEVPLGQLVGHMGEGTPGKPVLYFEIRRNGKPVDTLPFLP